MTLRDLCTAGLWLAFMGGSSAMADPAITLRGELSGNVSASMPLALGEGDFVQGQLEGDAQLYLLDELGQRVRWLIDASDLSRGFMFVAPGAGNYHLQLEAAGGQARQSYNLQVERIVPLAAQHAPTAVAPQSPVLAALQDSLGHGGDTTAFWAERERQGTPLVEPLAGQPDQRLVTFLWRGARHNVRLFGAPSGDHDWLTRLGDSDVWYASYVLPSSTRMSYKLAPDIPELDLPAGERRRALLATAQHDPLNTATWRERGDRYLAWSRLELPDAPAQPWLAERPGIARGSLEKARLSSQVLHEEREVYLYRPAGWQPTDTRRGLLVLFDAHAYTEQVPTATILDNLIASGTLPPTAALIIANPSEAARSRQLPPDPPFARFLAEELLPWARMQGLSASAQRTVIAGSSYGGLAAAYAALQYPQHFGNVLSMSGSFWWSPPDVEAQWLTREYATRPRAAVKLYLQAGLFESGKGSAGILETNRHLRDVLTARGYAVSYHETASGHDYLQWQGVLGEGVVELLGR